MKIFPLLTTKRLILNELREEDIPSIVRLASNEKIADLTRNIPKSYTEEHAVSWLKFTKENFSRGFHYAFAIRMKDNKEFIGTISLKLNEKKEHAELAYWIGEPYWNLGFATEAAMAVLKFGFKNLDLQKINASYLKFNKASGKVLKKIGLESSDIPGEKVLKNGQECELIICSLSRSNYFHS